MSEMAAPSVVEVWWHPRLLKSACLLLALIVLGFGLSVAAGWIEGTVPRIAWGGQFVPTAFNTALALSLSALALLLRLHGLHALGRGLSLPVVILALATLLQRVSGGALDVDNLFLAYQAPAEAPWLNRVAANTAWALLGLGLAGLLPDAPAPGRRRLRQGLSAAAGLVGALAVLSGWGDWHGAASLGGALRMSPLTGVALLALGLAWGLASAARVEREHLVLEPAVVLVALGGAVLTLLVWLSLAVSHLEVIEAQTRLIGDRTERLVAQALATPARATLRLAERLLAGQRAGPEGARLELGGASAPDVKAYFRDFPGLRALAVVGPQGLEPVGRSGDDSLPVSLRERLQAQWAAATADGTEPVGLQAEAGFLILRARPAGPDSPWVLAAVFETAPLFREVEAGLAADEGYELRMEGRVLAGRFLDPGRVHGVQHRFHLLGQGFELHNWPTPEQMAHVREHTSAGLLMLGLGLSFLAAMSLRLSHEARRRSAGAAMVSRRLAEETQERLQAQQALRQEQAQRMEALEAARRALVQAQLLGGIAGWELDPATGAVRWSDQAERVLGVDAAQLPRDRTALLEWVHPQDRPAVQDLHTRALTGPGPRQIEHRLTIPGREAVMHVVQRVQSAPSLQDRVHLTGTWQDITERRRAEAERARVEEENLLMLEHSRDLICIVSARGRFLRVSRASETILGVSPQELVGHHYREFLLPDDDLATTAALQEAVSGRPVSNFENRHRHRDGHLVVLSWTAFWDVQRRQMFCIGRDVTERRRRADLEAQQRMVLSLIARDRPLDEVLEAVVEMLEQLSDGLRGSILLLDAEHQTLHVHAAPHLPEAYSRAIEGVRIGPRAGSCGTAVHRRAFVQVDDIATDPLWDDYRHLALPHGLRACWSSPILGPDLGVLGTLAFYYPEVRSPDSWTLALADVGTDLAGIAIQRERQRQAQLRGELRARSLFEHVPAAALAVDTQGRVVECNANVPVLLGGELADWLGRPVQSLWREAREAPADFDAWARTTAEQPSVTVLSRRRDGTELELAVSVAPIEVEGRLEGHYILATDVTEVASKNRQIALQAQLIERTPDALVAVDAQGRVVLWNRGAVQLYGLGVQEVAGRDFAALFPADQQRVLREAMVRLAHRPQSRPAEIELSMQQPSGARQHVRLSLSGLDDGDAAVLIYGVDVTQRKLAEYALRRALVRAETQSARLGALGRVAVEVSRRLDSGELVDFLVDQARRLVTSHMAALSLNAGAGRAQPIHAVSLSDKYARWRSDDVQPDGSGLYALVLETGQPQMLTQQQLESHPRFRGFNAQASAHPPLRGWLAVPMFGRDGQVIGLVQASDKVDGDYDADDLALLTQFAQMAAAAVEGEALYRRAAQAEQALQRQLDVARAVAHSVGEGLLTVDGEGRVVFSNPACRGLLGLADGEEVGAALQRVHLGGRPLAEVACEVARTGRRLEGRDGRIEPPGHEARLLAYTLSPLLDAGRAEGCVAALRDITDLDRAHRQMLEREAFFNLSRDMFLTAGRDGVPRQVNPAFSRVMGFPPEELMAGPFNRFVHPEDRERTRRAYYADTTAGAVRTLVNRVRTAAGDYRWFEWTGSMGPDGLFYTVARDVTERLQAEREAQRLLADLERSNQELQEFAFVASHDLQEPLRKILAFADRLQVKHAAQLEPEARDYVERMAGAATRMRGLIQDLLAYSRVGTRERHLEPVAVGELVHEVIEQDLEPAIQAAGARIEVQAPHAVMADRGLLHHVLINLFSNALKFTDPQRLPQVQVSTRPEPADAAGRSMVVLEVADNGIGFDPAHAARIFQPFQRLHGRGRYEGSGIGLAIVKKIVERHEGRIEVRSQPGVGSVFSLYLPAAGGAGSPP